VRAAAEKVLAAVALVVLSPLLLVVAVAILISDPGPVLFLARRSGKYGIEFPMYKFRTMRVDAGGSRISTPGDQRVFPLGQLLRRLKVDELPQFINIIRGEMAIVGPRPEDPWFVEHYYTPKQRETLRVPPGLTSPGTLYYYSHIEQFLDESDPEGSYTSGPLAFKLEMDRLWVERRSLLLDLRLVLSTLGLLLGFRQVAEVSDFLPSQPMQSAARESDVRYQETKAGSSEPR
jgi:lipopolysaccharide/colanic/teichoic acid biosynthesis glycosyltransferase